MRRLTIERAMIIILFALLFALAARVPVDTDTWWHLRSGEHTLTQGMIYADPFSHSMNGQPWINHSWGAQIVLYAFWKLGGYLGLAVYMAGLATAGMAFVYKMSVGSAYLRAFAVVLGAATAAVFWSPRPQMLSFLLSAVVLYILTRYKRDQVDRLWLLPLIMGLWGNLHAGFSIGFILMAAFIGGEIMNRLFNPRDPQTLTWAGIRKLIVIALISAAALVINPYGLQMLLVPFQTVSIGALQEYIQEWNSPNFHERQTWPFIALLLGLLGAAGASRRGLNWTEFLLAAGTAFMALLAGRNIAVFAVAATPLLTVHLDALLTARGWVLQPLQTVTPRMARLNAVLVAVILFACAAKVLVILDQETVDDALKQTLPVDAVAWLAENPQPGPLFNSYNWGGYLIYMLPDQPVLVDGRTDLYGDALLTRYLSAATGGPVWREMFAEYDIRLAVIEAQSGLARLLGHEPGWSIAYEDEMAVVFTWEGADGGS
jgi:hypothetical protein